MLLTRTLAVASIAALVVTGLTPTGNAHPRDRSGASSKVVHDWERAAFRTVYPAVNPTPIPIGAVYLGFTSLAMHRAAQAADRKDASAEAAVATAAHDVLVEYFPGAAAALRDQLTASLAAVPDGRDEDRGKAAGARVADRLIASRADDGRNDTSIVYQRAAAPGVWQPPSPAPPGNMIGAWLGYVRPLVVHHPLRVDGPDALTSSDYTADYAEAKGYGRATGSLRSEEQTRTAIFMNSNVPVLYGDALLRRLETDPIGLADTARLFASMYTSMADALITCWRLKYEVGYWRPFQAIPLAATDGNPATAPDAAWTALLDNPPYPDYVSGHGCATGAAIESIRQTLGERTTLVLRNPALRVDREFQDLTSVETTAFMSRIWGGLHFRDAMEDAYVIGHEAAQRAHHELY